MSAGALLQRWFNQNIMGFSPPAPESLKTFKEKLEWNTASVERKAAFRVALDESFSGELWLLAQAFAKLVGLLTLFGLIFGFGLNNPNVMPPGTEPIIIVGITLSLILLVHALMPRFKIILKQKDWGMIALTDVSEDDASALYARYLWHWHRQCTRVAIDRMTLFICLVCNITLSFIMLNAVVTIGLRLLSFFS